MINSRDSHTDFNPGQKEFIEVPYRIGTIIELKNNPDILAKICQYRITVKDYRKVINVGLNTNIYGNELIDKDEIDCEITSEELLEKWKKTDRIIVGKLNPDSFIRIPGLWAEDDKVETSSYVPSNDSEVIANLIDGLEYDPSKTDEILAKFEDLGKPKGPVKCLKPKE